MSGPAFFTRVCNLLTYGFAYSLGSMAQSSAARPDHACRIWVEASAFVLAIYFVTRNLLPTAAARRTLAASVSISLFAMFCGILTAREWPRLGDIAGWFLGTYFTADLVVTGIASLVCAPSDDEAHPIKVNYEKLLFMSCTCLAAVMVICVGDSVSADRRVIRSFRTHKLAAQFLRASNIQFPAFLKARYDNIVGSACASSWVSLGFTVALSAALTKMVQVRAIPFPTIALPSPYGVSMYVTKCEVSLMEMATAFLLGIAFALPILAVVAIVRKKQTWV